MPAGAAELLALSVCMAGSATHPEHTSVAEARLDPCARTIEVALRVDAVHFEEALSHAEGTRVQLESSDDIGAIVDRYLSDRFQVRIRSGDSWPIRWVGYDPDGLEVWLFFETLAPEHLGPDGRATLEVRNRVMLERLSRQTNLVTFDDGEQRKSLTFAAGRDGWQELALPYAETGSGEARAGCWHERRLRRLTSPEGWLTPVGLVWLDEGEHAVGRRETHPLHYAGLPADDVGVVTLADGVVTFVAADGAAVSGVPDDGRLRSDAEGAATILRSGSCSFNVIQRGDRIGVRMKDQDAPLRRRFAGIDRFPFDAGWRIEAAWEPAAAATEVAVDLVIGGTTAEEIAGYAVFERHGHACRMVLMPGGAADEFFVVFGDTTNGTETYGGGRFLAAHLSADGSSVVLDFNRAYNPPCSFTPYATCPLPVPGNRLPYPITAGEKSWSKP